MSYCQRAEQAEADLVQARETTRRTKASVLAEQIAILRQINAPPEVIEMAERLLREAFTNEEHPKEKAK